MNKVEATTKFKIGDRLWHLNYYPSEDGCYHVKPRIITNIIVHFPSKSITYRLAGEESTFAWKSVNEDEIDLESRQVFSSKEKALSERDRLLALRSTEFARAKKKKIAQLEEELEALRKIK